MMRGEEIYIIYIKEKDDENSRKSLFSTAKIILKNKIES